jgi:hypothetical protein
MTNFVIDPKTKDLGGNIRHGDSWTFMPRLWTALVQRFGVSSMLDVGCGEGHAVKFFRSLGVVAHGIDGLPLNVHRAVTPIALHDLKRGSMFMPVDLVWSCEVAEHIDEKYVDNYVQTLANGKIIAMTHATPGQQGHHHVNCQDSYYWISKLIALGYQPLDEVSQWRGYAREPWQEGNHFTMNGLLLARI